MVFFGNGKNKVYTLKEALKLLQSGAKYDNYTAIPVSEEGEVGDGYILVPMNKKQSLNMKRNNFIRRIQEDNSVEVETVRYNNYQLAKRYNPANRSN